MKYSISPYQWSIRNFIIVLGLIFCITINNCSKESSPLVDNKLEIVENDETYFLGRFRRNNLLFTYEAKTENNITESKLIIADYPKMGELTEIKYTVNKALPSYKLAIHESVINKADQIKHQFTLELITEVVKNFELFGIMVLSNNKLDHTNELFQSMFFHNAILSSIKRSIENNKDCECTPHPAYFIDRTSFWCQEDYLINPQVFLQAIDDTNYKMTARDMEVYQFLQSNKSQSLISIDKLLNIYEPKANYMQRVARVYYHSTSKKLNSRGMLMYKEEEDCVKGGDLGCCGNYSGCCWYWSMLCLEHDIACFKCDRWHCGPKCKPGAN